MKIVCNGGYRTGSTLVYNLAAAVVGLKESVTMSGVHSSVVQTYGALQTEGTEVIKNHVWQPTGSEPLGVKVLYTYRDLRDLAVSFLYLAEKKVPEDHILIEARRQHLITGYMKYLQTTVWYDRTPVKKIMLVNYERYYGDIKKLLMDLGSFLGVGVSDEQSLKIANEWEIPKIQNKANKIAKDTHEIGTQLRHGHISDHKGEPGCWVKLLPPKLLTKILSIGVLDETGLY